MLARVRSHLTYSNVMSTIACFGVLAGGTAYAANTIGSDDVINDSLLSEDVKNGALRGVDVAPDTIGSTRVVDESLQGADVKNGSLTGGDINESTLGTVPNANTVGGKSADRLTVVCRQAGRVHPVTVPFAGSCFEQEARAAAEWEEASIACAQDGRRLPGVSELRAFAERADFEGGFIDYRYELTGDIAFISLPNGGWEHRYWTIGKAPDGLPPVVIGTDDIDLAREFRCIEPKSNE
jgi:hypothetical protein